MHLQDGFGRPALRKIPAEDLLARFFRDVHGAYQLIDLIFVHRDIRSLKPLEVIGLVFAVKGLKHGENHMPHIENRPIDIRK